MGIPVVLAPAEMMQAATVGLIRQLQNLRDQREPAHGAGDEKDWQKHVEGALGEFALAKVLDRFPSGAHGFRARDVGKWQVRTTRHPDGRLILHHSDADDDRFVLVTGVNGDYVLRGWILGRDGKQQKWWVDPSGKNRPAYFVPQSALRPLDRG